MYTYVHGKMYKMFQLHILLIFTFMCNLHVFVLGYSLQSYGSLELHIIVNMICNCKSESSNTLVKKYKNIYLHFHFFFFV